MMQNKIVVGITGGSGAGKSTVSALLSKRGWPVIDADAESRNVTKPGSPCLCEIERFFGSEYIFPDGSLDRKKLGRTVFADAEKLCYLTEITGKYIKEAIEEKIASETSPIVFVDGAILIGSGIRFDYMVSITADFAVRCRRIMERDSLSLEEAKNRLLSQKPEQFYIDNSDEVIKNDTVAEDIDIDGLLSKIKERFFGKQEAMNWGN